MMQELLQEQHDLLQRLQKVTDRIADEAHRREDVFTICADLEAFEVRVALGNVEQRMVALQQKQRRRQRQT